MENWLTKRVHLTPEKTALVFKQKKWSFAELQVEVNQRAKRLLTLSYPEGSRIGVLGSNSPELYFTILALQQMGHTIVFLNHRLTSYEMEQQLIDATVAGVLYQASFVGKIKQLSIHLQECSHSFQQVTELQEQTNFKPVPDFDLKKVTTIMYTSGTTGQAKGVQQTFDNHWWSAIGSVLNLGLTDEDSWLCPVPLFHISGFSIMMRSLIYGMPVYLFEKFDEKEINQTLLSGAGSIISVVSVMLKRLLVDLGNRHYPPQFRCMLLGGGPIDSGTLTNCQKLGIPVIQSYGMTETASQVVALSNDMAVKKSGSAGLPLFPVQLEVVMPSHEVCLPYQHGEVRIKAPNVTVGYLNQPRRSETEWFYTGDIGYLDNDGYLYIVSRLADLIISGGENIYPSEVEQVLMAHPSINDVAIVGKKDTQWEQVPIAFLVLEQDHELDIPELIHFCQSQLAQYKIPKEYKVVSQLPRNASGKVLRRNLV
ncbi:o-succinylbenzoate--CoA ligase [Carnobacterium maltaromaticum]|uniref:o-succinylbenzoate--CoA ligase n=1 Tax=Carnobacterium maltaromaticum TaxID=2751 RepID=UPI00295EA1D6|nr:o-succinylbenzoate--CoA ligase [Carnobacterium maltaromaticum]